MGRPRKETGIRPRVNSAGTIIGYRVFAFVAGKTGALPQFPADTPIGDLRAARDRLIEQYGGKPVVAGSLAADVARYLAKPEIAAKPSIRQITAILALWLDELGADRSRVSVTQADVEAIIQRWLRRYSPVTVYHRRTVLGRMYAVLGGENPVTGTTRPDHYRPEDRSMDWATIERILERMVWAEQFVPKLQRPSRSRLRVAVMAHTGIPAAELMKLRRQDFDRAGAFVRMPWRDKGKGTPAHTRELSPAGVAAFVELDAAGAWGRFSVSALGRAFKRAAKAVCGPATRLSTYWLRHSLGADCYRATGDSATVGRLLGHKPGSIVTQRYTMGAHAEVDRAALAAVTAARAAVPMPEIPPARTRQPHKRLRVAV
jgi:integrase